ncbi:MAG TPA: hypothetical protein PLZ51_05970 [Aggregatilineales bacterium]|nr:hypothetical protein [Aggregatilineales bacterium]
MLNAKLPIIYEDFLDFLLEKLSPEDILSFKASSNAQQRADELTELNKSGQINREERAELEQMIEIDLMISVLKASAMVMQKNVNITANQRLSGNS